jgi:hypothetical protein
MPDINQLCHICGKMAVHTCKLCGRPVCETHFEKKSGICTSHVTHGK